MRSAKKNYYVLQLDKEKKNIKNTWKILNNVLNRNKSKSLNTEFNLNGQIINDPKQIPENFNNFFINIGPNQALKIPDTNTHDSTYLSDAIDNTMFFSPITEDVLIDVINKLNTRKSSDYDNISALINKNMKYELSIPLTIIFNMSLSSGIVPDKLKIARVVPIHKKENKSIFNNYRPIAVLPGFSKLLERLVIQQVHFIYGLKMTSCLINNLASTQNIQHIWL